ncbi:hypothetical protein [Altericroceibacterium endophyticum]|uniref:Uncharacterized protein n=1 Tax=Altericroceibacterium endophyticum TaxID=1808508 RepID=A0A6I4T0X5_9SPHN|nr:hypothetical protein [Altericroceibacterium endophyticum]MXO64597.1 hypothetical protein [Altericroceibacterium endophyticum]
MTFEQQMIHDRSLRDAARALIDSDVAFLREDIEHRGLASRIGTRFVEGGADLADDTQDYLLENPAIVGGVLCAGLLWLFRRPIMQWLNPPEDAADQEPVQQSNRSQNKANLKNKEFRDGRS